MRTKINLLLVVLLSIAFASCDNDRKAPNKNTGSTFDEMYPNAKNKHWEREGGYYVVEFRDGGYEKKRGMMRKVYGI